MAQGFVLAGSGMILIAIGAWRLETRVLRRNGSSAIPILFCLVGIVALAITGLHAGLNRALAIFSAYTSAGGFIGMTIAAIQQEKCAGTTLANLGTGMRGGFVAVSAVAVPMCLLGTVMGALDAHNNWGIVLATGQGLFATTVTVRLWFLARAKWRLTEGGILGPNVFVPWQQALEYVWHGPDSFSITTAPDFAGLRQITIPVAPNSGDRAAAVLAMRLSKVRPLG